jgi:hypothetical protein
VFPVRAVKTTTAIAGGTAPNAAGTVSMAMFSSGAIETSGAVARRVAKLAVMIVSDVFVFAVRTVQAA